MTAPWHPAPNPGGQHTKAVRQAVAQWVTAQAVPGVQKVWAAIQGPDRIDWEAEGLATSGPRCQIVVLVGRITEERVATTGPTNFGGKLRHYPIVLEIHFNSALPDEWEAAQDAYDAIVDRLKECASGPGRDLGRPDFILQAGEFPGEASMESDAEEPIDMDGGIYITGTVEFTVSQYLQQQTGP